MNNLLVFSGNYHTRRRKIRSTVLKLLSQVEQVDKDFQTSHNIIENTYNETEIKLNNTVLNYSGFESEYKCYYSFSTNTNSDHQKVPINENPQILANNLLEIEMDSDIDSPKNDEWHARFMDLSDDDDYDDCNFNTEKNECDILNIKEDLASWAVTFNITQNALTHLLHILHPIIPNLPKDARSLQNTRRNIEIKNIAGGEYYYFGVVYWLSKLLIMFPPNSELKTLKLHINIDGIPIFKSSTASIWPILGCIKDIKEFIFPIAIFCSNNKPNSLDAYLKDFVNEIKDLEKSAFVDNQGNRYMVKLEAIVCDAPARAFIKCIKSHTAYNCCERCFQKGEWIGKIILPDLLAPLRTDNSFQAQEDINHHIDNLISPLSELSLGMVTCFPLDYMHLICLGVVRRIINQWVNGTKKCQKISQTTLLVISEKLKFIKFYVPREFCRKPCSISEFKKWKATELRQFLLYTGPVILKSVLPSDVYSNFLDLSVAVRILLTPALVENYLYYVKDLLKYFVARFCNLYGIDQCVYNIHSIIHLSDDAKRYGALENISSFPYESYLGRLKKLVRRAHLPCSQIVQRIFEGHLTQTNELLNSNKNVFKKCHSEGPVPLSYRHCLQFKQYYGPTYFASIADADCCFKINGKIGIITNFLQEPLSTSYEAYVVFQEYELLQSFFTDPMDSKLLSIYFVEKLSCFSQIFRVKDLKCKYFRLPYKTGFVVIPQMHLH